MRRKTSIILYSVVSISIIISFLVFPSSNAAETSSVASTKSNPQNIRRVKKKRKKAYVPPKRRRRPVQRAKPVVRKRSRRNARSVGTRGRRLSSRRLTKRQLAVLRRAQAARRAAIARQRAFEEALRRETAVNIQKDITAGEDLEIRRVAISALGSYAGTIVAMDPVTGRVYTIVNQEWAVRRGFKPCSTVKLVTGLAGLNEGIINPIQTIEISASGSQQLDLTDALAYSNNGFFQSVGGQVGFEKMMKYGRMLGLGEMTGINHPNEYAGRLPVLKSGYQINHMSSHGDDIEITPIQLATMVSAIVNGGKLLTPHMPRTVAESENFKIEVRREIEIPRERLLRIIPGMIGAVNYGSGHRAYSMTETIAGKTGTCSGQGAKLGLFAAATPIENPRLAISVVLRGAGARGSSASEVAGKIFRALSYRFGHANDPNALQMAKTPSELIPHSKITPAEAAAISDEDKEADSADETVVADSENSDPQTQHVTGISSKSGVKKVIMPVGPKALPNNKENPAAQTINTEPSLNSAPVQSSSPEKNEEEKNVNGANNRQQRPRRTAPTAP